MLQAQIVSYTDDGVPEIHLYSILGPNVRMPLSADHFPFIYPNEFLFCTFQNIVFINGELVARQFAEWNQQPLTEV